MLSPSERDLLRRGIAEFNAGEFFECHETLEDLWNVLDGTRKRTVQGILQAAVGLLHGERGNLTGAQKLLDDAIAKLEEPAAGESIGLPLAPFVETLRSCRRRVDETRRGEREWLREDEVPVLPPLPGDGADTGAAAAGSGGSAAAPGVPRRA